MLPPIVITTKKQIIQELDHIPESYLEIVLSFLCFLETQSGHDAGLSSKAEAIIQKGLNTAISKPKQSVSEIWAEFEFVRNKMSENPENHEP